MDNPLITKEAIQELQKALVPVAEKLGQGGEWVYKVYYKQQIVYGVQGIMGFILALVLLLITYIAIRKAIKNETSDTWGTVAVVLILITIPALVIGTTELFQSVGRILNPDYYVLQDLLSIIK